MWQLDAYEEVASYGDGRRFRAVLSREGDQREMFVTISATADGCAPELLAFPYSEDVRTSGLSAVERHLGDAEPPAHIAVYGCRTDFAPAA